MYLIPDQNVEHDVGYRIMVSPGLMASVHRHIFCLRLDPSIEDCIESSTLYDDVAAFGWTATSKPHGVAFGAESFNIEKEAFLDLGASRIGSANPSRNEAASPRSARIQSRRSSTQLQLADPGSMHGVWDRIRRPPHSSHRR